MKYSYEQRLTIVSRVNQGEVLVHLSKEYHIHKTQMLAWVRMWNRFCLTTIFSLNAPLDPSPAASLLLPLFFFICL